MTRFVNSKNSFSCCCLAATIFLFAPNTAQADPLTLSGVVTMDKFSLSIATVTAHLISSDFEVMISTNASNWPGTNGCAPCPTGSHVDIGAFFPDEPSGSGSGTIHGVTYPTFALVNGFFRFDGSTIVPPTTPGETFTLTVPFTASGSFQPSLTSGVNALPFYTAAVAGNGLATLTFIPAPEFPAPEFAPHWYITRAVYQFGNVSATPEPITFALFGGGLALTAIRHRRRQKRC
jgi:hypothetical protein